jgi:hypothetical protein
VAAQQPPRPSASSLLNAKRGDKLPPDLAKSAAAAAAWALENLPPRLRERARQAREQAKALTPQEIARRAKEAQAARARSGVPAQGPGTTMAEQIRAAKERPLRTGPRVSMFDHTKGTKVRIAGKEVQLPEDAGIVHRVVVGMIRQEDLMKFGPPPDSQRLVIRRGQATVSVGTRTGKIYRINTPPGQEGAFNFLKEALGQR